MKRGIVFLFVFVFTTAALAQQETCPALVDEALSSVTNVCEVLGRNQVCYGYNQVAAFDADGQTLADFAEAGDIAELIQVNRIVTFSLDVANNIWGIALLSLQANFPDTIPGQNVTVIAFGLNELRGEEETMQAFRFVSGIGQSQCDDVPHDGLLIQTPAGTGTVNFTINGIQVDIGSTVLLRAASQSQLELTTLEGTVTVTSANVSETVNAGFTITVEENQPPEVPTALVGETIAMLPLDLLPEDVELPTPDEESTAEAIGTEAPEGTALPDTSSISFETVLSVGGCAAAGTSAVTAGEPFAFRLGWSEATLDLVSSYVASAQHVLTYDGESVPLASTQGPRSVLAEEEISFRYDWFWPVAEALPGDHEMVWSDGLGSTLTCTVTGE